ncbi:MAG: N-acetylglucosamine-6-phosphate deacetylase, partial [Thermoguttaceae bacterium]|nr:N-acetylglucosamine-6-phosphate deacetylase [Thermoguttaceae bacterium]
MQTYIGKRFDNSDAVEISVENDKICGVKPAVGVSSEDLPVIGPGFFDIQVNGAVGVELSSLSLTESGVVKVLEKMLRDGVFRICPTLTTQSLEAMVHAARTIRSALEIRPDLRDVVWGIHLEGPFISTAEGAVGAHPKQFCIPYSREFFRNIQDACGGLVK